MRARGFWSLDQVSDDELVGSLKELVARGSWTEARIVAHLAELETRRLHLRGARSLFDYCQRRLGLSQNEAFYRIQAARIARKFPVVFELLEQRQVHLTALALIRDYIDAENHVELLRQVSGKTKEQILVLLAERTPRPDVKSRIRKLSVQAGRIAAGPTGMLEPRSAASYRLQLNTSPSLKEKLQLAADLMSHSNPSGDLAVVVERALDVLIEKLRQRRFGQTSQIAPKAESRASASNQRKAASADDARRAPNDRKEKREHIAHEARRQLVERDGLGCTFVCDDGQRCGARAFLQIHHDEAWARGGPDTMENLRLVCAAHNRLLAEQELGVAHVTAAVRRRRGQAA